MGNPKGSDVERLAERHLCHECEQRHLREAEGICQFRNCSEPEFETTDACFRHAVMAAAGIQRRSAPVVREYAQPDDRDPMKTAVVYYLSVNGHVKIGTTTNLLGRMRTFCLPSSALLALEPGGLKVEARRHGEFAHLRVERELFEPSPLLADHIAQVRQMFGDPMVFLT